MIIKDLKKYLHYCAALGRLMFFGKDCCWAHCVTKYTVLKLSFPSLQAQMWIVGK